MDKQQKEARRRQEDAALNKGLLWIAVAILFEVLLVLAYRFFINPYIREVEISIAIGRGLEVVRIAGTAAAAACLVWAYQRMKKKASFTLPCSLALIALIAVLDSHVLLMFRKAGLHMLFFLMPCLGGLGLVYYLYQREMFLATAAAGAAGVGLWFIRFGGRVEAVLCAVLIVLAAVCAVALKKRDGTVELAGRKFQVLPRNASITPVLISCAVGAVAMAAAFLVKSNLSYYLMFAMAAWIFALLVYYTVKLM